MQEEDPELERELLGDDAAAALNDESEDLNEDQFLEGADELDLPEDDEEDEQEDKDEDLKGEETDSDLEEYYRELGIENEPDDSGDQGVKKKSKKAKAVKNRIVATPGMSKEDMRRKVLNDLIENTNKNPTFSSISRVIKIVKQMFFAG
jgi:hypothetical protein